MEILDHPIIITDLVMCVVRYHGEEATTNDGQARRMSGSRFAERLEVNPVLG